MTYDISSYEAIIHGEPRTYYRVLMYDAQGRPTRGNWIYRNREDAVEAAERRVAYEAKWSGK
jgi:hypothetical protein